MTPEEVYRDLCRTMATRGGHYPGCDLPEFYEMARELFTPVEAALSNFMPKGHFTAGVLAAVIGLTEEETRTILESMADKGLCHSVRIGHLRVYGGPPFVPGIFEFQFMRGTWTDRDRKLARLISAYKKAYDQIRPSFETKFPPMRVITIDRKVSAGNRVHTYDQVSSYIDRNEVISVSTCYCRHEARLVDENDQCGKPNETCMMFGFTAVYIIERGIGRLITKDEARDILNRAEEAGLVHVSQNAQEIGFLCNCCPCHCVALKAALAQPKPGLVFNSGFQPVFDASLCTSCELCLERCPGAALTSGQDDIPQVNLDRCFGCGVCATGCPSEAVALKERSGVAPPASDHKAYAAALKETRWTS